MSATVDAPSAITRSLRALGAQAAAAVADDLRATAVEALKAAPELAGELAELGAKASRLLAEAAAGRLRPDDAEAGASRLRSAAALVAARAMEGAARALAERYQRGLELAISLGVQAVEVVVAGAARGALAGLAR